MKALDDAARGELLEALVGGRKLAHFELDARGTITARAGDAQAFEAAEPQLADLPRPEPGERLLLPRLELSPGCSTDVHIVAHEAGVRLFLIDATAEAERERHFQQRGNELRLVLRSWGLEVFEETPEGLVPSGARPAWLQALAPDAAHPEALFEASAFLENFLVDARAHWRSGSPGILRSGSWSESDASGREWPLEASAGRLEDGRGMLLVQSTPGEYRQQQELLQAARRRDLELESLRKQVDRREVLLNCIVHDLLAPLGTMVGSMSLARGQKLSPERASELLGLGLAQGQRQATLIRGILDAYSGELSELERFETDPDLAPELCAAAREAQLAAGAAFEARGVELALESELEHEPVIADGPRLARIQANLLENALRHSPRASRVTMRLRAVEADDEGPAGLELAIEDQGQGVPAARVAELFTRFAQGPQGGAAGLGLYFCKRTAEAWGGSVGYRVAPSGGAAFFVRLLSARRTAREGGPPPSE